MNVYILLITSVFLSSALVVAFDKRYEGEMKRLYRILPISVLSAVPIAIFGWLYIIKFQPLYDIWHSIQAESLRQIHIERNIIYFLFFSILELAYALLASIVTIIFGLVAIGTGAYAVFCVASVLMTIVMLPIRALLSVVRGIWVVTMCWPGLVVREIVYVFTRPAAVSEIKRIIDMEDVNEAGKQTADILREKVREVNQSTSWRRSNTVLGATTRRFRDFAQSISEKRARVLREHNDSISHVADAAREYIETLHRARKGRGKNGR